MTAVDIVIYSIGFILALAGHILLVLLAFKENTWWGLGTLFIPGVNLVFAVIHWSITKTPFLIMQNLEVKSC